jgi:CheY-like chemotaxis protein
MRDNMPVTLFIDIDLPEKQFHQALEKLEQDDVLSKIPIIACTWNDDSVYSQIEGVAASVNKSLLYEDFVKILERVRVNLKDDLSGGELYVNE